MEINVQTISDVAREVEITVTAEELEPHFEKAYQKYQKDIEIKGFRKGKAPIDIIKKLYGDLIEHDSLSEIAAEFYKKAVKEKELKPIGEPTLVDLDYKKGEQLKFRIQYDVRPQIQLKDYKGFEVQKVIHTVTEEELENELLRLRQINATLSEVDEVTDSEHVVTIDIQDLDETGAPIIGKKSENLKIYLADEQLDQSIKDVLKHAKKGEEYKIKFDRKNANGETQTINIQIKVNRIQKFILPPEDDEFVAKITKGKFKSLEEFRKHMREELNSYWKEKSERQVINSIIYEIINKHDFQVPESLIRNVLSALLDDAKNEYPNRQLPEDFDIDKFNEEYRTYAIYQAKWALLKEELIKAENITVTDDDIESFAEKEAEKIKIPKERLIQYYKSSEQVKDRIIDEKLIKILVDSVKIKEVPEKI